MKKMGDYVVEAEIKELSASLAMGNSENQEAEGSYWEANIVQKSCSIVQCCCSVYPLDYGPDDDIMETHIP